MLKVIFSSIVRYYHLRVRTSVTLEMKSRLYAGELLIMFPPTLL